MRIFAGFVFVIACIAGVFAFGDAQTRAQYCCTALPPPTPTPTPVPQAAYTYHGVQIYNGAATVPDPVAAQNIAAAPVDPNSATIITNLNASVTFDSSSEASDLIANIAGPSPTPSPSVVATSNPVGHVPPISTGPAGGGAGATIPWIVGTYKIQGFCLTNCQSKSDAHFVVLDLNTHLTTQGGGGDSFPGGPAFSAFNGIIDQLDNTYCSQQSNKGDNVTVAGIPILGFTVMGEDMTAAASGTPILHPSSMIVPVSTVHSGTAGVNISTLSTNSVGTCAGNATTQCLKFGDLWRLKATYNCAGLSTTKAQAWCVSLQQYGAYVNDLGAQPVFRFALDSSGVDDTDSATVAFQHSLTLSAGDIITRGTVHC